MGGPASGHGGGPPGEVCPLQCETAPEALRHTILLWKPQDPERLVAGSSRGLAGHHHTVLSPTCSAGVKNNSKRVLAESARLCALPPQHGFQTQEGDSSAVKRQSSLVAALHTLSRSHLATSWLPSEARLSAASSPGESPPRVATCVLQGVCTSILSQSPGLAVIGWPVSTPRGL